MNNKFWPEPRVRAIGFFSDSSLYAEVLKIAAKYDYFAKSDLNETFVNLVKGLIYIDKISETAIDNLIKELLLFKWIKNYLSEAKNAEENYKMFTSNKGNSFYSITNEGKTALQLYQNQRDSFFDKLILELHRIYIIPGWFIQRLWNLNFAGQGEVVIPYPEKKWKPSSRKWEDNAWTSELTHQMEISFVKTKKLFPYSFPVTFEDWISESKIAWEHIAHTKPRKQDKNAKNIYTPRKRLALSMREASLKLLFSNRNPQKFTNDFSSDHPPLLPRKYSYWCARLEEIGLINYTDYNPNFSGRILYPVCSFKKALPSLDFRFVNNLENPNGESLCLFRPQWSNIKNIFYETLLEEYNRIYLQVKSLYISIQDLRDAVCRILRLSNFIFDRYIENASEESLYKKTQYRIALETDIREDQRTSLQRRPVYIFHKFISLIAITHQI